jgi:hypothetical protein
VGRPEYRVEFIDKVEFFALLSELQAKLGLAIDVFYAKLGHEKAPSVASSDSTLPVVKRNNPFVSDVNNTVPVTQPRAPEAVPAAHVAHDLNPRVDGGVIREFLAPQPAGHMVDGVDGPLQDPHISQAYPVSLLGAKAGVNSGIDQKAPRNSTLDVDLPIPVVPIGSEKIAYSQLAAPTSHLTKQNASTDSYSADLIRATQDTEAPMPLPTHFSSQKEVVPSTHELEASDNPVRRTG